MLKSSYLKKYKEKNPLELDEKYLKDDENYIIGNYRPMNEKELSTMNSKKLHNVVEDILYNPKVNSLIYAGNAKAEIKLLKHGHEAMKKNMTCSNAGSLKGDPNNIFLKRKKMEAIVAIKQEADIYKQEKLNKKMELIEKNKLKFRELRLEKNEERVRSIYDLNYIRLNRFEEIYQNIKNKILEYKEFTQADTKDNEEANKINAYNIKSSLYQNNNNTINANYNSKYSNSNYLNTNVERIIEDDRENRNYGYPSKKVTNNLLSLSSNPKQSERNITNVITNNGQYANNSYNINANTITNNNNYLTTSINNRKKNTDYSYMVYNHQNSNDESNFNYNSSSYNNTHNNLDENEASKYKGNNALTTFNNYSTAVTQVSNGNKGKRKNYHTTYSSYSNQPNPAEMRKFFMEAEKTSLPAKIILPDVGINTNNVFSRLYTNTMKTKSNDHNKPVISDLERKKFEEKNKIKVTDFHVKGVLNSHSGKEFTIKITDDTIEKCIKNIANGPYPKSFYSRDSHGTIRLNQKNITSNANEIKPNNDDIENYNIDILKITDEEHGNTYLHKAVIDQVPELVDYFIKKNIDVDSQNIYLETPLIIAVKLKNKDIIQLLLDAKSDVGITDSRGHDCIHYADVSYISFYIL